MAFLCQQETILVPKRREITYKINEKREERKIGNSVKQKKEEIRNIYREKGFKDELFDEIVRVIIF